MVFKQANTILAYNMRIFIRVITKYLFIMIGF